MVPKLSSRTPTISLHSSPSLPSSSCHLLLLQSPEVPQGINCPQDQQTSAFGCQEENLLSLSEYHLFPSCVLRLSINFSPGRLTMGIFFPPEKTPPPSRKITVENNSQEQSMCWVILTEITLCKTYQVPGGDVVPWMLFLPQSSGLSLEFWKTILHTNLHTESYKNRQQLIEKYPKIRQA